MRPRSILLVPLVPGGYIDNPPDGCPAATTYCPNENKYESIRVVEYVRCGKHSYCKESRCWRKTDQDREARARIRMLKGNGGE